MAGYRSFGFDERLLKWAYIDSGMELEGGLDDED
jgi:hypothetical protein